MANNNFPDEHIEAGTDAIDHQQYLNYGSITP